MGKHFENVGAAMCGLGLLLWYLGGARAISRLVTTKPLLLASLVLVVLALGVVMALDRRGLKLAFGVGAVLAAGCALTMWTAVALANATFDSSHVEPIPSWILSLYKPSRVAPQVRVRWHDTHVSFDAQDAPGCQVDQPAVLHMKRGAFGMPWIDKITCSAQDAQVPVH